MKVILVSPFIDPVAVGEPRWCFDLAKAICARTEVVIVAQSPRNRDFRVADLFPGVEVFEHDPWQLDFLPARVHAMAKPNYLRFYPSARKALRQILSRGGATCGHHFGPLALRFPTPLSGLGLPYVFGPLGGSLPPPPGLEVTRRNQPWFTRFRDFDAFRWRNDPMMRASYEGAACLVGVAPYVAELLSNLALQRFEAKSEVRARVVEGVDDAITARVLRSSPLRLLCVSRLVPSKGVQFALQALSRLDPSLDWRMDIVGDGPMRAELERMTDGLNLASRVVFHGHIARAEVDAFYRDADVFLFPSVQEPSGSVLFEAMSWGLPIIATRYGGPASHVDGRFGIQVPVDKPDAFVDLFAAAIGRLAGQPRLRLAMGKAAKEAAASDQSLDAAADFYVELYRQIAKSKARH